MELIPLRPADYVTTAWSGGATTQLCICPEGAVYADRAFLWRISSATVTVKESDFTPLPDYHRLISVLRGDMTLAHNAGEPFTLRPYEVHAFEGSDATHSWGKCTDFNLMLRRDKADGAMEHLALAGEHVIVSARPQAEELLLYCAEGHCTAECKGKSLAMCAGESLLLRQPCGAVLTLQSAGNAHLMLCQMWRV